MSESNIDLATIANVELRNDGAEIKLTFADEHEQSVTVTLKPAHLAGIIGEFVKILKAVDFNMAAPSELNTEPLNFNRPPVIYLAADLNCAIDLDTDELQLRFLTTEGETVQVALVPPQVESLFRFLNQKKQFDDNQIVH